MIARKHMRALKKCIACASAAARDAVETRDETLAALLMLRDAHEALFLLKATEEGNSIARCFMSKAKEMLPVKTYTRIFESALLKSEGR